jgi:hypothetical protein
VFWQGLFSSTWKNIAQDFQYYVPSARGKTYRRNCNIYSKDSR